MLNPRLLLAALFLAATTSLISPPDVFAQQVEATLETIEMVESGGSADLQFRIAVRNGEHSVASNVQVIFEDGVQVHVGDVPIEGTSVSAPERRILDTSESSTGSSPLPVTLRFVLDGVNVELAQTLVVVLPEPAEEGQ